MQLDIMDDKSITVPKGNIYQLFSLDALNIIGKVNCCPLRPLMSANFTKLWLDAVMYQNIGP